MERVTVDDVDSRWYRGLEALYLLPAVALLVTALYMGASVLSDGTGLAGTVEALYWPLLLVGAAAGILWTLLTPLCLYRDAKLVERADTSWDVSPTLYTVLWLVGGWFVIAVYLVQRHRYVVDRDRGDWWWLVVALSLVGFLAVGVLPYVAWWALGFDLWYAFVVSFVGAWVTNAVLVVALYFDSIHVRLNSGWHPNPSVAAGVGTLLAFVPGLAALYGVYHLGRRQVTDGL